MRFGIAVAVVALAVAAPNTHAKDWSTIGTYGVGKMSCGSYTEARKTPRGAASGMMISWVQGFVTAAEILTAQDYDTTDGNGMMAFLDKYCGENPLKNVSDGATALTVSLQRTQ